MLPVTSDMLKLHMNLLEALGHLGVWDWPTNIVHPIVGTKYGEAAFHCYVPQTCSSIPGYIRKSSTISAFKSNLKTHVFNIAYPNG